jgi:hypothetical protein
MIPARLGRLGRLEKPPPVVVTRTDLPAKSLVALLMPTGWALTAEGERELARLLEGAVAPDGAGTALRRRGSSCWVLVLTSDAALIVASLRDLAAEFMVKIVPPERGG